jgi:hypothetical protein
MLSLAQNRFLHLCFTRPALAILLECMGCILYDHHKTETLKVLGKSEVRETKEALTFSEQRSDNKTIYVYYYYYYYYYYCNWCSIIGFWAVN